MNQGTDKSEDMEGASGGEYPPEAFLESFLDNPHHRAWMSDCRQEIEDGFEFFFRNDQIAGFDPKTGKRIGTGIPRPKPQPFSNFEF